MVIEFGAPATEGGTSPIDVSCQPKSGDSFPVGETTVACTGRDAASQTAACSFAVTIDPPPPRIQATHYLAFGDSLTEGRIFVSVSGRAGSPDSYPYLLETELAARYRAQTIVVENAGVGGEDATVGRTRLRHLLDGGDAEAVLIMEGANDLDFLAITGRGTSGFPDVRRAIDGMVRDAQARGRRVFLATLPPQREGGSRAEAAELVVPFNKEIRSVAAARNVPLVDVFSVIRSDLSLIGPDGLHLTAAGYERVAHAFASAVIPALELH
jgi:acyl-CoA thioesterase-1